MNSTVDMTKGNIYKILLFFALPLLLGNVFQLLYSLVDTIIASHYIDSIAIGAIGATSSVNYLIISFSSGMGAGASIIISRFFGEKKYDDIRRSIAGVIIINIILAGILTLFIVLFSDVILHALKVPDDIFEGSKSYFTISVLGLIATMMYNTLSGVLRALGNSSVAIMVLIFACVLNVGGDFLFVGAFNLGVGGTALATIVSQILSVIVLLFYIYFRYPLLRVKKEDFKFNKYIYSQILSTGLSMGLMNSVYAIGGIVMSSAVNNLGSEIVTARTTGRKIVEVLFLPGGSLASAASVFVAQNYGAKNMKRANEGIVKSIHLLFVWALLVLFMYILEEPLCRIISNTDDEFIIHNAVMYIKITLPFYFPLGILIILRNCFQSLGRKIIPFISSSIELIFKIVSGLVWIPNLGFIGECITEPISWIVCFFFCSITYIIYYKLKIFDKARLKFDNNND